MRSPATKHLTSLAGATVLATLVLAAPLAAPADAASSPGTISTIAGGVGGPGPARRISVDLCGTINERGGCGVSFAGGNLYFTDLGPPNFRGGMVRQVSLRTGTLSTPAGDGQAGFGGDGGPATGAQLSQPQDVSVDQQGNLLVTDGVSVRVVAARTGTFYGQAMTARDIYTVAGGGTSAKNGVPATSASIRPVGATADRDGNIVICAARAVRVVAARTGTFYGQAMTAGDIYTIAGTGGDGPAGDGIPATSAGIRPAGVAVDASGNVLLADRTRVRVVAAASGTFYGQAMTAGDIYSIAGQGSVLRDRVPATESAVAPYGVAFDRAGNVLLADWSHHRVRVIAASTGIFYGQAMQAGDIYTIAGGGAERQNGAVATSAWLGRAHTVTVDSAGNVVVIADHAGRVQVVASKSGTFYGVRMSAGRIYPIAGNGLDWSSGKGGIAARAQFLPLSPVTYDGGNLAVVTAVGMGDDIDLLASRAGTFFGRAMRAGHLYHLAGDGSAGFSGNGVPAGRAGVGLITSLAADGHGNLVIGDDANDRVLVIAASSGRFYGRAMLGGHVYSVAGTGFGGDTGDGGPAVKAHVVPDSVAVDPHGNILIGQVPRLRLVAAHSGTFYGVSMKAGDIYTIAGGQAGTGGDGGPARDAQFEGLASIKTDGIEGVLVCDQDRIRMIATASGTFFGESMKAGDIYTVAGTGSPGQSGDGTPARTADISPSALAIDNAGNMAFFDGATGRIRVVPAGTGTFYGIPMTAGHLYSITGSGTGTLGDGGPSTGATLGSPFTGALAASGQGLAFAGDHIRVRLIAS